MPGGAWPSRRSGAPSSSLSFSQSITGSSLPTPLTIPETGTQEIGKKEAMDTEGGQRVKAGNVSSALLGERTIKRVMAHVTDTMGC